jgi:hypothetical protein
VTVVLPEPPFGLMTSVVFALMSAPPGYVPPAENT